MTMTHQDMLAYASDITSGSRSVKKAELVEFMKTFLASPGDAGAGDATLVPAVTVTVTPNGAVHVGKNANRVYSRAEARGLAAKVLAAAERAT